MTSDRNKQIAHEARLRGVAIVEGFESLAGPPEQQLLTALNALAVALAIIARRADNLDILQSAFRTARVLAEVDFSDVPLFETMGNA